MKWIILHLWFFPQDCQNSIPRVQRNILDISTCKPKHFFPNWKINETKKVNIKNVDFVLYYHVKWQYDVQQHIFKFQYFWANSTQRFLDKLFSKNSNSWSILQFCCDRYYSLIPFGEFTRLSNKNSRSVLSWIVKKGKILIKNQIYISYEWNVSPCISVFSIIKTIDFDGKSLERQNILDLFFGLPRLLGN